MQVCILAGKEYCDEIETSCHINPIELPSPEIIRLLPGEKAFLVIANQCAHWCGNPLYPLHTISYTPPVVAHTALALVSATGGVQARGLS